MKIGDPLSVIGTLRVGYGGRNWVEYKPEKGTAFLVHQIIAMCNAIGLVHTDQLLPEEIAAVKARLAIARKGTVTKAIEEKAMTTKATKAAKKGSKRR